MAITIKELHRTTGKYVRNAGASPSSLIVTDRGKPVAVLASLSRIRPARRERAILPAYEALMKKKPGKDLLDDLDAVRGDR